MRLRSEFIQLPLQFDADRILFELECLRAADLVSHPADASNLAVILISVNGDNNHDFSTRGQMKRTPLLDRCPYLEQVLASFRAPLSRSRLMILPPGASVAPHDDICFHWYRRCRIHVPIVTNRSVTFFCNGKSVHMAAGESWLFDNFLNHHVRNDGDTTRIHLVADTRGSPEFWTMVDRGADPFGAKQLAPGDITRVAYAADVKPKLDVEEYAVDVPTAAEVQQFSRDILTEARARANGSELEAIVETVERFTSDWQSAYAVHGASAEGLADYSRILTSLRTSPLFWPMVSAFPPHSPGHVALRVLDTVFMASNQRRAYTPDPQVARAALSDIEALAGARPQAQPGPNA